MLLLYRHAESLIAALCHVITFICFQFQQAVGAELTWIEDTKNKLMALGHIRLEQDQTMAQLQVQKVMKCGFKATSRTPM